MSEDLEELRKIRKLLESIDQRGMFFMRRIWKVDLLTWLKSRWKA